ncbi:hypothetical protein GALMADRAFT_1091171 [Galerina marginata CBS 339.88]|uniref:Uncharacterized protein n=1 Tax=Galerina marginata (strain CBS 339.88) TaxID=685588 RepID=A0A067TBH6_GALM3|nr:hypothetical protein GALMADRAFT_1091171 [Galerina marginata CBS 339.88]
MPMLLSASSIMKRVGFFPFSLPVRATLQPSSRPFRSCISVLQTVLSLDRLYQQSLTNGLCLPVRHGPHAPHPSASTDVSFLSVTLSPPTSNLAKSLHVVVPPSPSRITSTSSFLPRFGSSWDLNVIIAHLL